MGNQPTKQSINQTGKQKKYVHWKSAEAPSMPGRPILIPVSDQQPDAITLQWDKPQSDGGSPILGYIIEHRRVGSTSWIRSVSMLIVKNEASIAGLEPGWKYQFRAFAENVVGRSQPSILSDALPVSLQMRNTNTLPTFITELKDTNAIENERLEMRVRVFGNPQPEISWFKDGFEIFSSRRIKIVNENDFSMLIIHQVALTDEGEIKCTATNRAGHVATKAKLIVEAPPKIRLPRNYEDGLIIEEDDTLKLKAGIAGQPFPAVIWSREGIVISDGNKFEISTTDKHTLLKIAKVKRIDRGEYSIRAINKLGEDIASFLVTVTARPRSPGKVKLVQSHGTSVALAWTEPLDDGGCKIGSYIVEYFRIGWDVWLKATTTRRLQATLNDLIEGSEYKFRVKAENPYGVSEPSPESDTLYIKSSSSQPTPTETSMSISDKMKLIPPSKGSRISNEQSTSPIRATSPTVRTIKPELFESEQLNMEMSYGAPANRVDSAKTKEDRGTSPKPILKQRSPIPTPRKNHTNLTLEINNAVSSEPVQRSISPKIEITPTDENPKDELSKRSLSPKSKPEANSPLAESSKKDNTSPLTIRRSISPSQTSNSEQRNVNSPVLTETDLKIEERLKMEREKDEMKTSSKTKSLHPESVLKENGNLSPKAPSEKVLKKSFEYLFNKMNYNEDNKNLVEKRETEDRKKSEQLPQIVLENNQNDSPDQQLSSDAEGRHRDEVHTSNEYMLVFYPDGRAKDIEEPESRNYYGADNQGPPVLSYSFPNLSTLDEFSFQASIRRSASSTELLYEKAMARFYEAVEMEEERKEKKKANNLGEHLVVQKTTLQNLDSIAETQEISGYIQESERQTKDVIDFPKENNNNITKDIYEEYKNSINISENNNVVNSAPTEVFNPVNRRNLMEMTENQHVTTPVNNREQYEDEEANDIYESKKENYEDSYKHFSDAEVKENTFKNSLFEDERHVDVDYGSDYTDSTASESESSMEYFRREVITRSTSGGIGRKKVTLSPVRYESSEDDTLSGARQTKSVASSDSIPKSILKKPSSTENVVSPNLNLKSNINPISNFNTNINANPDLDLDPKQNIVSNSNYPNVGSSSNIKTNLITNVEVNPSQTLVSNSNPILNPGPNLKSTSNPKPNPISNQNLNPNPYSNPNPNPNPNPISNLNYSPHPAPNSNSNPNPNPNPNPNINLSQKPKSNQTSNPIQNPRSNPNPYPEPRSNQTSNPIQNPRSNPNPYPEPKSNQTSNPIQNPRSNPNPYPEPKSNQTSNPNQSLYLNPDDGRRKSEDLKENPKLSPLSKAKSISDRKLRGLKSFLTGGRSKSSKDKKSSKEIAPPLTPEPTTSKAPEPVKVEKKLVKAESDEGAQVIVDYYSNIVQELGHSTYKTPLYLNTAELKKQSERAELEDMSFRRNSEIDADEELLLLQHKSKPRMSIVERMQAKHVRPEKSSHCIDNKVAVLAHDESDTPDIEEQVISKLHFDALPIRPVVKKVVKTKKIIKRTARSKSRDRSKTQELNTGTVYPPPSIPSILINETDLERLHALHKQSSIGQTEDDLLKQYSGEIEDDKKNEIIKYDPEEVIAEAQDNVHSAISYITDLGLFVFACWVYLFKDAYMVLPILALMVYRRIGEAITRNLPSFLKKKPC